MEALNEAGRQARMSELERQDSLKHLMADMAQSIMKRPPVH